MSRNFISNAIIKKAYPIEKSTEIPEFMKKAVLWNKGRDAEKFTLGQTLSHHWGRTINASDNSLFTLLSQMYNPIYFNEPYAKKMKHPGIVVNPFLVFNIVLGLSVEDLSENRGLFLGIDDCKFLQPVYIGDTLHAESEVLAKRASNSDETKKIVTWKTKGYNQNDQQVIEYVRSNLFIPDLMAESNV